MESAKATITSVTEPVLTVDQPGDEREPANPPTCACGTYARPLGHRPRCPVAVAEAKALETGEPKKPSARKVLKRQIEARYRFYSPERWAAEKAKEAELAKLSKGDLADLADLES